MDTVCGRVMGFQVLLVDDDTAVLRTMKGIFQLRQFDVCTAVSAEAAVATLAERRFDLVVTDMRMERTTSGYDVIRAAKSQSYKPVTVVLSAYPIPASEWRAAGADAMFLKGTGVFHMFDDVANMVHQRHCGRGKPPEHAPDPRRRGKRGSRK